MVVAPRHFLAEALKREEMRDYLFEPSERARTAFVSFAMLAVLAMLGGILAYWTWVWFAPRPEPRSQPVAASMVRAVSAQVLFGDARRERGETRVAAAGMTLLGVVAAAGNLPGYAVVRMEPQKSRTVREGEDVVPGVRLAEVHPDRVVLTRAGVRETLAWPQKPATVNGK